MKTLMLCIPVSLLIILGLKLTHNSRIPDLEKLLVEKQARIGEIEDSLSRIYGTIKYVDLDKRLYTPYGDEVVTRHYNDTVVNSYGDHEKFVVDHKIEIRKISTEQ